MNSQKTFIIGDVHGCITELEELLELIDPAPEDEIIFIGDLINKGPDSRAVLELVKSLGAIVIQGNKEAGFIAAMNDHRPLTQNDLETRDQLGDDLDYWVQWMQDLPLFHETNDYLIVHGGLVPGQHPSESKPELLTTIRTWDGIGINLDNPDDPSWFDLYHGEKLVVFGHWAAMGLMVRCNAICLDSGCVYGKRLTALELPARRLHQVEAHNEYASIE